MCVCVLSECTSFTSACAVLPSGGKITQFYSVESLSFPTVGNLVLWRTKMKVSFFWLECIYEFEVQYYSHFQFFALHWQPPMCLLLQHSTIFFHLPPENAPTSLCMISRPTPALWLVTMFFLPIPPFSVLQELEVEVVPPNHQAVSGVTYIFHL